MLNLVPRLREALVKFGLTGQFTETDYAVLRSVLAGAVRRAVRDELFDGLVHVFFERHLLNDRRRDELIELPDEALGFALRHRFRQVVADEQDDHRAYHALRAHVRVALEEPGHSRPPLPLGEGRGEGLPPLDRRRANGGDSGSWPISIRDGDHFVATQVRRAVQALWHEQRVRPTVAQATSELLRRYVEEPILVEESQDTPEVLRRQIDGQRLSEAILRVLSSDEKDLLRHVLVGDVSVERWAEQRGISRSTAYRMLARLKSLCQVELEERSQLTALEALRALTDPRSQ